MQKIKTDIPRLNQDNSEQSSLFLPNFCSLKMVFSVVIIGELLAFILTLAPMRLEHQRWNDLGLISLFIQWNGMVGSASLCLLRPALTRYSNQFAAVVSYLVLLLSITLISETTFFVLQYYSMEEMIVSVTHWEFLLHNLLIGGIISALALRYFYIQDQWRVKMEAESCTRLQLLQARIRPHFLFNSMNTIASLTRTRPETAERITEDLAELFRMLFKSDHEMIPWSRELDLCQRYIEIEKQRLGERLHISWQVKSVPGDAMVPALLLQPLLENAIFHGIEPEINGGEIKVIGQFRNRQLVLTVQNTNSQNLVHRQGNKMALDNIRERLITHYDGQARLACREEDDIYYVKLTIPYIKHDNKDVT